MNHILRRYTQIDFKSILVRWVSPIREIRVICG